MRWLDRVVLRWRVWTGVEHCFWSPCDYPEETIWRSDCGCMFHIADGTPDDNGFLYCPHCGRRLIREGLR